MRSLFHVSFPSANQPLVQIPTRKELLTINFKTKKISESSTETVADAQAQAYNKESRAIAYVQNNQLFVTDNTGKQHNSLTMVHAI